MTKTPMTLSQMTEAWNKLAPEAMKLGLPVKVHTSAFENRATGERRLAWLTAQIAAAKPKAKRAARKRA